MCWRCFLSLLLVAVGCGSGAAGGKAGIGGRGEAGVGGAAGTAGVMGGPGTAGPLGIDGSVLGRISSDAGASFDAGITGLLGSYYASARAAAFMTCIDPVIDFDPGRSDLQPEEVSWTGEIFVDGTQAVEIEANDDDQVSPTIGGQSTGAGAMGLTGVRTDLANLTGWQPLTVDIVRTDHSMPFKAILIRQQLPADGAPSPVEPAPTEVLKPE
jgi:hypothetical protein